MKNTRSLPVLAIVLAVAGFVLASAPWAKSAELTGPAPTAESLKKQGDRILEKIDVVMKERDEAKAQVATLQAQQQQQSLVAEYYKAVAEKNETILRLVAVQQQLNAVQGELAAAKAEIETLKKPAAPEAKK